MGGLGITTNSPLQNADTFRDIRQPGTQGTVACGSRVKAAAVIGNHQEDSPVLDLRRDSGLASVGVFDHIIQ